MFTSLDALCTVGTEIPVDRLDDTTGTGPLAYAACLALCAWWMGPPCLVACIPLFFTPSP